MEIASVIHKGLRDFIEKDDPKKLPQDKIARIRNILTALILASGIESVIGLPGWRIHQLKGDRAGEWSISVSGNWRITFKVEKGCIEDLNPEDYH